MTVFYINSICPGNGGEDSEYSFFHSKRRPAPWLDLVALQNCRPARGTV